MDLAIKNGVLVDGTGRAGYRGDIGISGGRIVALGDVEGRATEEIDAEGAIVAPGFIDVHTHYDAQVCWDPMLSPSVYHGVTTVLAGNCGFSLAPLTGKQDDLDYLLAMLARVEGMPLPALEAGVTATWHSFGDYLDTFDGKTAINAAFLVGHSALRRYVMGERAVGHEASPDELREMAALLRRSLAEGGVGFSTTVSSTHSDHNGDPVPSRWASMDELTSLASVVSEFPGTWVEVIPGTGDFGEDQYEITTKLSLAAQRPVNWNALVVATDLTGRLETQLQTHRYAAARGAKVYGLATGCPMKMILNLRTGFILDMAEGWAKIMTLPDAEKLKAIASPAVRQTLRAGISRTSNLAREVFDELASATIEDVRSARNARWKGHLMGEYAAATDCDPLDALFNLAIEEELWMSFSPPAPGRDDASWELRDKVVHDPGCILGGSDAGAHLDMLDSFSMSSQFLSEAVRKRHLMSFEEGIHLLTGVPAARFGLSGRGILAKGAAADIVILDPETIACGPIEMRNDLPLSQPRLFAGSVGVRHVIVNGVPVAADNQPTGRLGGRMLRSGIDTVTVPLH